jgi:hypothetical protein
VTLKPITPAGIIRAAAAPYDPRAVVVMHRRHFEPMVHRDGRERRPCGYTWVQYPDGPYECPVCVTDQPMPFAMRCQDPSQFLGHEWVWVDGHGPTGRWEPLSDYVLMPRADWEAAVTALRTLPPHVLEPGISVIPQLVEKLAEAYVRLGQLEKDSDSGRHGAQGDLATLQILGHETPTGDRA